MTCPNCGATCEQDTVDVGVGELPVGPWGCPECHWVQPDIPMARDDEDVEEVTVSFHPDLMSERRWPPLPFFRCDCGFATDHAMVMIGHQRSTH